jgi:hypothetical protein
MNESNRYRLSLHVSHPSIRADDVIRHFNFEVRYSRSVGDSRVTPNGRSLGGTYLETNISFDVSNGVISSEKLSLGACISDSIEKLPSKEIIKSFMETGGDCFYLIGIYSEDNFLVDIPAKLLSNISEYGLGLKLDFYGGPD